MPIKMLVLRTPDVRLDSWPVISSCVQELGQINSAINCYAKYLAD